jgi:type I restriction enzyme S subunit
MLASRIRDGLAAIQDLEHVLEMVDTRKRGLYRAILTAAFAGELVPQDATDEPASALLERIVAERAASNSHRPARANRPSVQRERVNL